MYEIISGNIEKDILYQVTGGTSVVYNTITYLSGEFFVGVSSITTYTKTLGTEIVTYAANFESSTNEFEQPTYTGLFTDQANFESSTNELGNRLAYYDSYTSEEKQQNPTVTGLNDWNYKLKLNPYNDPTLLELTLLTSLSELDYSELNQLIASNSNVTGTIAANVLTDLKTQTF